MTNAINESNDKPNSSTDKLSAQNHSSSQDPSKLTARLRAILAVVLIADILDLMDSTITNIAAPSIAANIGGGQLLIKWLGAAYALAIGVLLVVGGRLGDRYGKRKLFLIGIAGFTIASAFCGLSVNPVMIIIGRLVQGGFGALLIPQGMSILMATFTPEQFPRAVSAFGPVMSISSVLGPIAAGLIIQANLAGLGWRPMFLMNILLGLTGFIAALKLLPHDKANSSEKLDLAGSLLLGSSMFGLLYGLIEGSSDGWKFIPIVSLAAGAILLALFALHQGKAENPLIKPSLFSNRGFTSGLLLGLAFFAAVNGLSYIISLFFQFVLTLTPYQTALAMAPMAIGIVISSLICRPLLNILGRKLVIAGLLLTLIGAFGLIISILFLVSGKDVWVTAPAILFIGAGMGACFSSIYEVALGDIAPSEAGSASGSLSAVQQLASAIGSAVITTLFFKLQAASGDTQAMVISILTVAAAICLCLGLVWLLPKTAPQETF